MTLKYSGPNNGHCGKEVTIREIHPGELFAISTNPLAFDNVRMKTDEGDTAIHLETGILCGWGGRDDLIKVEMDCSGLRKV